MSQAFHKIILILLTVLLLTQVSCKKETIDIANISYNYFPTDDKRWVIYEVDSIYHAENDNNNDDSVYTFHFEIREQLDSAFLDGAGRLNQIVKRFKRKDSIADWSLTDVWTQTVTTVGAYRNENNICYHKLSYPIGVESYWNGNDANTLAEEMYSYEYFHEPGFVNGMAFDSTLAVLQIDENNYVERIFGREIYAAGVGLIYKERDELGKKNGIVVKGLEYRMRLIAFGTN